MSDLTLLGVACVLIGCYALWLDAQLDRARMTITKAREIIEAVADGEIEVYRVNGDIKVKRGLHGRASEAVN